ncbi:hypothetical protein [Actinocatenispora rupis]|uniref:Uncharacterized protein n=1 Tax=Actinocatenispora rupis TaxID=519421 RepID=A0A8J3IZS3_9ACTN|nr:hypothetical protein [Actinocatenispora rupis]GID11865.1 hypothetical protein Aru02nite_27540 [Actinocatenispora rupis]
MADLSTDRVMLARAVAAAAGSTPGVARLVPGTGVPVVTHVPGGTVTGVGLGPAAVSVHVAVDRFPLEPVITGVVEAVSAVLAGAGDPRRVEVVVEDVDEAAVRRAARARDAD